MEEGRGEGGWAGKGRKGKRMYPVACERHQKSKKQFLAVKVSCVCVCACVRACV